MWDICGSWFSWEVGAQGVSISIVPEWHQVVPDLGGPNPDFELEELFVFNKKPLKLTIKVGDFSDVCSGLQRDYFYQKIDFAKPANSECDLLVHNLPDQIQITWFREPEYLDRTLDDLRAIAAFRNEHWYYIRFNSVFLVGKYGMGTDSTLKEMFMTGKIGAAALSNKTMSFGQSGHAPKQFSERGLLRELGEQF